jgi:hypothetical protein
LEAGAEAARLTRDISARKRMKIVRTVARMVRARAARSI